MFRNKPDDPKTDRIISIVSAVAGIICTISLYFLLFPNDWLNNLVSIFGLSISVPISIGLGILIYLVIGVILTVYVTKRKVSTMKKTGHCFNRDKLEKRWETIEVTEE
jgi:uncharacterized integral membrane protein